MAFLGPHIYCAKDYGTWNLSVLTGKTSPQGPLTQDTSLYECWEKDLPLVKDDWVGEHQKELGIHNLGPDGVHPPVLRELVDIIVRSLIVIFERL